MLYVVGSPGSFCRCAKKKGGRKRQMHEYFGKCSDISIDDWWKLQSRRVHTYLFFEMLPNPFTRLRSSQRKVDEQELTDKL